MIRDLILLLLGAITGFLFTLTMTGVLLRDNVILKLDDLLYKVLCQTELWLEKQDWKLREYLVEKFPVLNDYNTITDSEADELLKEEDQRLGLK
jgi:hypothetical protein